jgi:ABC-type amino acid transport substrate-binding protein
MLFASKNKLHLFESVKELSDLGNADVIVAALRGAIFYESYPQLLENKEFASKIVYISDDQNMSNFVLKGRADGYIDSETEGKHYLSSQPAYRENIIPLFRITSDDEAGSKMMFSKARITSEQVDIFDVALKDLHDSGEYEQISKLY